MSTPTSGIDDLVTALIRATREGRVPWDMDSGYRRLAILGEVQLLLTKTHSVQKGFSDAVSVRLDVSRPFSKDRGRDVCISRREGKLTDVPDLFELWEAVENGREKTADETITDVIRKLETIAPVASAYQLRTVVGYAADASQAETVADLLISSSQWFQVDPLPFDRYQFTLKEENRKFLSEHLLPECPPDPPEAEE